MSNKRSKLAVRDIALEIIERVMVDYGGERRLPYVIRLDHASGMNDRVKKTPSFRPALSRSTRWRQY